MFFFNYYLKKNLGGSVVGPCALSVMEWSDVIVQLDTAFNNLNLVSDSTLMVKLLGCQSDPGVSVNQVLSLEDQLIRSCCRLLNGLGLCDADLVVDASRRLSRGSELVLVGLRNDHDPLP